MRIQNLGLLVLGFLGATISVGRGDHRGDCVPIVALADQMQDHARDLSCEFERCYRWTQQYWDLQSNAQRISLCSGHLKQLARTGNGVHEIQCELEAISTANRNLLQLLSGRQTFDGHGTHHAAWRYEPPASANGEVKRILECLDKSICQANEHLAKLIGPPISAQRHVPGRDYRRPQYTSVPFNFGPVASNRMPRYTFSIGR